MAVAVLFFLVGLSAVMATHQELSRYCLLSNPINERRSGICTANDVRIAQIVLVGAPRSCVVGDKVSITMKANFVATANARYDVGSYIALDGGDAYTGECYGYTLHNVTTGVPPVNVGSLAGNSDGPFAEKEGSDADLCGDLDQGDDVWQTIRNVTFVCRDVNSDGVADVGTCLSWDINTKNRCTDINTALLGTNSKCNCGSVNVLGLNVCSTAQLQCRGTSGVINDAPCEPVHSSRVIITSSSSSTQFPPSAVLYANMYLDFQTIDQHLAFEWFNQTDINSANLDTRFFNSVNTVIREDIEYPCTTTARTLCGGGCRSIFRSNVIPRLFREASDTATSCPNLGTISTALTAASFTCFAKALTATSPKESVSIIFAKGGVIGGALTKEGTIWELFQVNGTRGAVLASPINPSTPRSWNSPFNLRPVQQTTFYDFNKLNTVTGCSGTIPCPDATHVAFAVDEQTSVDALGFSTSVKGLLKDTVYGFSSPAAQFGIGWSNGNGATSTSSIVLTAPSLLIGDKTSLSNFIAARVQFRGTTDFAHLIQTTINTYWPTAPSATSPPRKLVVFVGGADSPVHGISWATVQALYISRGVTVFVEAFGSGAGQTALIANIAPNPNLVYSWANANLLSSDYGFLWRKLCPGTTPLCPCGGFCECSSGASCTCPASCNSNDACRPATCTNGATGCVADPGAALQCTGSNKCKIYAPCVDSEPNAPTGNASCPTPVDVVCPVSPDPCFSYTCDPSVGCTLVPKTCPASDGCNSFRCNSSNAGKCEAFSVKNCDDGNRCTVDSCTAGVCSNVAATATQLQAICPVGSCQTATCVNNVCTVTGVCDPADPCLTNACASVVSSCSSVVCISKATANASAWDCQDIPATAGSTERADCVAALSGNPARYCYNNPTPGACPASTMCDTYSCVSGACRQTQTVCNPRNSCETASCDPVRGCVFQPIACPVNDSCTTYSCSAGVCVASPVVCGGVVDKCRPKRCVVPSGCVEFDPCLGAPSADPCKQSVCQLAPSNANGYTCNSSSALAVDCRDFTCRAAGVPARVVVSVGARDAFLAAYGTVTPVCDELQCTVDTCDASTGCVNTPSLCAATGCNATLGCFETNNADNYTPGVCQFTVVQSLIDFCGVCLGDFTTCFFASVSAAATAGGIAGGVVAGIVVGAVIAALLAAFLSKKSYDYYQAKSSMSSTGLNNNPAFKADNNIGTMPDRH